MTLDVDIPEPPSLRGPQDPGDYDAVVEPDARTGDDARRQELAGFLEAGAWEDAFDDWATETYMTEAEFRIVLEMDLLDELDFYWNQSTDDVGYLVPPVPEDLPGDREDLDSDAIEEELDTLARTVSEVLEDDYVQRDGEEFGYSWE